MIASLNLRCFKPNKTQTYQNKMIKVADHPLIIQKISLLRKQETSSKEFRHLINEISLLLGFLATEDLDLRKQKIVINIVPSRILFFSYFFLLEFLSNWKAVYSI